MFIGPLEDTFGWTRTQINVSLTLGAFVGFFAPWIGRMMDRNGARWVMAVSLALVGASFLLRAVMTDLWQFYLFSTLIFFGTPGAAMLPAGRLVGVWFPAIRGRMMGLVTAGNNFGGMISVPLAALVIAVAGWRWGFASIGLLMFVVLLLVVLVVRDQPEDVAREAGKRWAPRGDPGRAAREALQGYSVRDAIRTPGLWFLIAGMTTQQFLRTGVATQLVPHLEDIGFTTGQAAGAVSLLAFFAIGSKIGFGRLSETITARYAYVIIVGIQFVGVGLLVLAHEGHTLTLVALAIFGSGMGGVGALGPLAITEMFGLRNYGAIMGVTRLGTTVPLVGGPIMAGLIYDATGKYELMFVITLGFLAVAFVSFLLARPPPRRPGMAGAAD